MNYTNLCSKSGPSKIDKDLVKSYLFEEKLIVKVWLSIYLYTVIDMLR